MELKPHTDLKIQDYSIVQKETGRKTLEDIPIPEKEQKLEEGTEEILELEAEEVPHEEDEEKQESRIVNINMSLTGKIMGWALVLLILMILLLLIKYMNKKPKNK